MRLSRPFLVLLLCLGCRFAQAEDAAKPAFDPYNPILLNETAVQKARDGDTGTALILLERAHLLAPHDTRITRNLQALRDWQAGRRSVAQEEPPSIAHHSTATDLPPLEALWPKK